MIMPIDIDKKEFSRDKRGYNSREVDEFLDLIVADYEKILNDNRSMAHKIKALEKQLEETQKDDNAMLETLETAKKLMADISASAERRAELMMRDAELEAENMLLDAKVTVRQLSDEHVVLSNKVRRLRNNFRKMLEAELASLDDDEFDLIKELDRSDVSSIDRELNPEAVKVERKSPTLIIDKADVDAAQDSIPVSDPKHATISDLADGLKKMADDPAALDNTIILK
ncbi:MAG: DivIVA domain-containing protein [Clostridiales bacterium]|nr:DivIVA domain-containing protein [Clostridiales bacterium]